MKPNMGLFTKKHKPAADGLALSPLDAKSEVALLAPRGPSALSQRVDSPDTITVERKISISTDSEPSTPTAPNITALPQFDFVDATPEKDSPKTEKDILGKETTVTQTEKNIPEAEETALEAEEKRALEVEARAEEGDDEVVYPSGPKLGLIILALCLSVFLVALDNTIIATAIPKITDQFNSLDDVGWYGSAYLLTTCSLQLFYGKLYTFYSIKVVYLAAIVVFEIGSAVCGSAPTSTALIVGRAIAGMGSAGVFSGAFVIIAYTVPMAKRPAFTGIIGAMYGIASIAGPLLGGAFTDGPGWGWCFYINLPLGAVTILVIIFFFHSPQRKLEKKEPLMVRAKQLDLGGTAVFIVAVITLLLALQWGGSTYAWSNWRIILCLTLFAILTLVFIAIQWYMGDNATIPFNIIKRRSVAAACFFAFALGGAFFVLIFWVPIWFQAIKGASALKSGIMCLPMVLALVLANIICGVGTTALGYYNPFYYASVLLASIGAGLLTTFKVNSGANVWIGYQIIYGLGVGFGMQQALITVQAVLPLKDVPIGTALAAFMQTFGGALFVSVAQNIFNNHLISQIPIQAPGIDPMIVVHTGATSLKDAVPAQFLHGVQLAYNSALTRTWYIAVALSVLTIIPTVLVEWKSVKGMKPGVAAV